MAHVALSWAAVILLTGTLFALLHIPGKGPRRGREPASRSANLDVRQAELARQAMRDLQVKVIIGVVHLQQSSAARGGGGGGRPGQPIIDDETLDRLLGEFDGRDPAEISRRAVMIGELRGGQAALDDFLESGRGELGELTAEDSVLLNFVRERLIRNASASPPPAAPSAEQSALLKRRMGWYGDLLLEPPVGFTSPARREAAIGPAKGMAGILVAGGLLALAVFVAGIVFLSVFFVQRGKGSITTRMVVGSPYGGIYIETFAVWMALFFLTQLGGSLLPGLLGITNPHLVMVVDVAGSLSTLAALAWPVWRGVPWAAVKADIGLTRPAKTDPAWKEPVWGVLGWMAGLPVLVGAAIVSAILVLILGPVFAPAPDNTPQEATGAEGHPIFGILAADPSLILWGFVLAAVMAPLIEEIFFRGVLHRHLREALGARMGPSAAFWLALPAGGLVFAAVHPQGVVSLLPLAAMGCTFGMIREWRGTLWASMAAHAVHNGLLICFIGLALTR